VQRFKYSHVRLVLILLQRIKETNKDWEWKKIIYNYLLYHQNRICSFYMLYRGSMNQRFAWSWSGWCISLCIWYFIIKAFGYIGIIHMRTNSHRVFVCLFCLDTWVTYCWTSYSCVNNDAG
jgi:hypothetical protein